MKQNIITLVLLALLIAAPALGAPGDTVATTCREHRIAGGLIVHVGCGDGKTTGTLRPGESFRVHGLDTDAAQVRKARAHLQKLGVYGPVSVDTFNGTDLPYADDMVNLLIVSGKAPGVRRAEILRVLAPRGVALVGEAKIVKPVPDDVDEWTHYLYGAGGNPVSRDMRVAPPGRLQWNGGPRWSRSHETDMSLTAGAVANGRIIHTHDEGPIGIHETPRTTRRLPDKCSLVARDAYNGVILWKRPMPGWGSAAWDAERWRFGKRDQMWSSPLTLPRRLVVIGDRVYVTLSYRTHVSELDAVTGKTLREFKQTDGAEEIVVHNGRLLARIRPKEGLETVLALDIASGKTLWSRPTVKMDDVTLAARGQRVCFVNAKSLVMLDGRTGKETWRVTVSAGARSRRAVPASTLVLHDEVVLLGRPGSVRALSAKDGKVLWTQKTNASFRGPPDVFIADSLAWVGTLNTIGRDLKTGQVVKQIKPGLLFTTGHHSRCHRARATEKYLLYNYRGIEFLDLRSDGHMRHDWVRGTCRYGLIPANGLIYTPPHSCFCYPGVKLTGFNALAAKGGESKVEGRRSKVPRLEKGPAYGKNPQSEIRPSTALRASNPQSDWPTYRHDNARSGCASVGVPDKVKPAWRTVLRGKISPPVVAAGRVFVAGRDSHTVHCLSAETGKALWACTAGGPVDSPPTISKGRVLFGCTDGTVYCLRASDGALVWRFVAAPQDRRIMSYGRLESARPAHGSVLVENDTVYFAIGRSSYLDGGIALYGLDLATGAVRHHARLAGPAPDLTKPNPRAHEMDGSLNDILVSNGQKLFLTQNVFDLALKSVPAPRIAKWGARKTDLHLVATGGFLDDTMFDRNYWMHARRWPGLYVANATSKAGQILVFDKTTTYGMHMFTTKFSRSPYFEPAAGGYELFADDNDNEPVLAQRDANRERGSMTRAKPPKWSVNIAMRTRAMVLTPPAGKEKTGRLFLAGPPDVIDPKDPLAALEGRGGALLWSVSAADGATKAEYRLKAPPVFDGLISAGGKLYLTTTDSAVTCWSSRR